jgi:hypothetical protein
MLIVLSMTIATQYATTRISYSYAIVHPSNADIRFIASDNSSDDAKRCLRVNTNASGSRTLTLELGDWSPDTKKNYTAAFGIVNEEQFTVSITHINMTGNSSYITMWLHGDRDIDYAGDGAASVKVIDEGTALYSASDTVWTFGAGDGDVTTMNGGETGATDIITGWDDSSGIRFSENDANNSVNSTSDFVWFGISLNVPSNAEDVAAASGTIYINFKADTTS